MIDRLKCQLTCSVFLLIFGWIGPLYSASDTVIPAFDHSLYDQLLSQYVQKGWVDYENLKNHREPLDQYVALLGDLSKVTYSLMTNREKIAFWINAYNAITLQIVLDHYPITSSTLSGLAAPKNSIRQIPGAWNKITRHVKGEAMTLDHIEHEILRREFHIPQVHMALVCASQSCPPLRREAYIGEQLIKQLDDQSKVFLSLSSNLRMDDEKHQVYLSAIFNWFGKDFLPGDGPKEPAFLNQKERAVINFVIEYAPDEIRQFLIENQYQIKYLDYDWTLNDVKEKPNNAD